MVKISTEHKGERPSFSRHDLDKIKCVLEFIRLKSSDPSDYQCL